ncbi:uncharacterized protein SCHCODRAFT_02360465 [Schizophyllum commune H4-8]|uniref:uncharacterized protein n=1 Tax=Schizophyllum commune (strain H4-8 / FGSC 9210) TaxID=578458 RepID=UPI002160FB11|nr:uncharacterized protein SCHCODRAFT_02360465 [Schizophyllum commune H4-8]KAI5889150.1 hypothetical protein SCHCODRAFT_02360465 [Schizophyllum commune H4-8]
MLRDDMQGADEDELMSPDQCATRSTYRHNYPFGEQGRASNGRARRAAPIHDSRAPSARRFRGQKQSWRSSQNQSSRIVCGGSLVLGDDHQILSRLYCVLPSCGTRSWSIVRRPDWGPQEVHAGSASDRRGTMHPTAPESLAGRQCRAYLDLLLPHPTST